MLSKTDYITYLKHPAWLWLRKHNPDFLPAPDDNAQAIIDEGREFEKRAEQIFPEAIHLDRSNYADIREWANDTKALLEQGDLQMQEMMSLLAVAPSASTPELTVIDGLRDQKDGDTGEALSQDALDDDVCSGSDDATDDDGAVAESMDDQDSDELQAEPGTFDDGGFIDERHGEPASDEGFGDDDSQMPLLSA